ncbi:MAG: ComF family protein [Ascidiaceihabitans sp.]|uniref:ComF family protein n=1 Tax=Ascidiaceihabitans sp. TaxID=1872644 RepID=UPI003297EF15
MAHPALQTTLALVYPPRCLTCGDRVDSDFGLCGTCWRDVAFIGSNACDGCGAPILGGEDIAQGEALKCDDCLTIARPWRKGRAALIYKGTGRKMILALKHGDRQEVVHPASLWMANAVRDILEPRTLIAPVPLHWTRLLKRRFNQSAALANAMAQRLDVPCCPDLLQRFKRTRSLDGMTRDARFRHMQDAIAPHPKRKHRMAGRPVLLVDDVMTTGATLAASTQACYDAGASDVCVVALARVVKDA